MSQGAQPPPSPSPPTPRPILRLALEVVNRIAAGEVIQRPANAIKELVENSIDAGATSITVTVADGGLRSLAVQDDGHGIREADLPLLCERHTTSKLRTFDDLRSISSFGFRGEALASISHVARVTVTTMTAQAPCAFRATYLGGLLEDGKPPKPCAGNRGTVLQADDLFYNLRQRRDALNNPAEELRKVLHVVQRYALHFSGRVGFVLRRLGAPSSEVSTQATASLDANVGALFGGELARELLSLHHAEDDNSLGGVKFDARMSSCNYTAGKRLIFVLFINDRLVECAPLKRAVREVYARSGMAKGRHPFLYASFRMKPENVDVNVHPTKAEVRFRFEEEILSLFERLLDTTLKASGAASRPFQVHSVATPLLANPVSVLSFDDRVLQSYQSDANPAWREVRVSSKEQKLDAFFAPQQQRPPPAQRVSSQQQLLLTSEAQSPKRSHSGDCHADHDDHGEHDLSPVVSQLSSQFQPSTARAMVKRPKRRLTVLSSVLELLDEADATHHAGLAELLREHVFVGLVDANRALVQHRLNLYLVDVPHVMHAFFYQEILEQFQSFEPLRLSEPPSLSALLRLGLLHRNQVQAKPFADLDRAEQDALVDACVSVLSVPLRRAMLRDYFGITVDDELRLVALPLVVQNYVPDWTQLPQLLLRLATKVSYLSEKDCFRSVATELASFFAPCRLTNAHLLPEEELSERSFMIQFVLFDALKGCDFKPPKALASGPVRNLCGLDGLYKVFERC